MSCHYYADFEMLSHCTELCNLAQERLCGIDQALDYLKENASSFVDDDIAELINDLEESKASLLEKIRQVSSEANTEMTYSAIQSLIRDARSLLHNANDIGVIRMGAIKSIIRESLDASIANHTDELERMAKGYARTRSELPDFLETVPDAEVKSAVRLLSRNPVYNDLSLGELKQLAEKRLHPDMALSDSEKMIIKNKIIAEMDEHNVDKETMSFVMGDSVTPSGILEILNASDEAIISEKIRKKAINAIISNIVDKGFIVDKKNIRFLREENSVKIIAMKPGGQRAEFNIKLDGSFVYKFDEYEGQACQKDLTSFIDDLNSIYGIKIGNITETWSNPDKVSKMSYQKMDVMKGD
ncbi:hypothetical protein MmiHf6_02460 [Methanimicrococcus hongohii]|uniref:Uncharacterized protein n=1 Tax=Methanimicrococcus hongohii TaxID=3028295 RepID=A0AA96V9H8_9EURY|nr:hypothetical protein [Methanimicrococcus sp. Hf6]WNY22952.1 hypothetical protein MmiHf6_02460 [Methanimicrococcus sp. Hf6]